MTDYTGYWRLRFTASLRLSVLGHRIVEERMRRREVVIMGHFNMQFKRISSAMTTHQILSRCSRWMLAAVIFLLTTHDKRRHPLLLLPLIFHNLLFIHSSVLSDSLQNIILNADLSSFSCINSRYVGQAG